MNSETIRKFRALTPRMQVFARVTTFGLFPLVLVCIFVAELMRGIAKAFQYAWLEVRINSNAAKVFWRDTARGK